MIMNDFQVKVFFKLRIRLANPFHPIQFDTDMERIVELAAQEGWIPAIRQAARANAGKPENQTIVNIYGGALTAIRANPVNYQAILDKFDPDTLPFSEDERNELKSFKDNPQFYFQRRWAYLTVVEQRNPLLKQ